MATARRLVEGDRYVREGKFTQWEYMLLLGGDIHGKTLGVVGFGRIGRAWPVAPSASGCACSTRTRWRRPAIQEAELKATRVDLATLLRESDFVSLHTPLLPETRHLINAESLRTMKKTAYLINAARGPVVDEAALVQALREHWIAGRASTFSRTEPKVHPGLIGLPNVVIAPAYRQRIPRHPAGDGPPGRGQLPGGARGQGAADSGEPGSPVAALSAWSFSGSPRSASGTPADQPPRWTGCLWWWRRARSWRCSDPPGAGRRPPCG